MSFYVHLFGNHRLLSSHTALLWNLDRFYLPKELRQVPFQRGFNQNKAQISENFSLLLRQIGYLIQVTANSVFTIFTLAILRASAIASSFSTSNSLLSFFARASHASATASSFSLSHSSHCCLKASSFSFWNFLVNSLNLSSSARFLCSSIRRWTFS